MTMKDIIIDLGKCDRKYTENVYKWEDIHNEIYLKNYIGDNVIYMCGIMFGKDHEDLLIEVVNGQDVYVTESGIPLGYYEGETGDCLLNMEYVEEETNKLFDNSFKPYKKFAFNIDTKKVVQIRGTLFNNIKEITINKIKVACKIIIDFNKKVQNNDILSKRINILKTRKHIDKCLIADGKDKKYSKCLCTIDLDGVKLTYEYIDAPERVYKRYTESWIRRGHTRKYKSGKIAYVKESECKSRITVGEKLRG